MSIYKNVPVLTRARAATTTRCGACGERCLISWENEAFLAIKELGPGKFEIVVPSLSILAEPPVALVDKVVDKKGTRAVAEAYLQHLYSEEGQEIAARHFYRPTDAKIATKYASQFPPIKLFTLMKHLADGRTHSRCTCGWRNFDQIYQK